MYTARVGEGSSGSYLPAIFGVAVHIERSKQSHQNLLITSSGWDKHRHTCADPYTLILGTL